jgi:rubrerythrin
MKLQQINRGKSQYYHVYLPKNIVERVLEWHQSDNLEYKVINNSLVLKKVTQAVNKYLEELSCPVCYNHCVIIKIIKNPKRNEFIIISRCPQDHSIIKKTFLQANLAEWKWYIHETINICDICGGPLEEQFRKHSKSTARSFHKIKFICRDCGRRRIKVIADIILTPENPPENVIPPVIQKNREITSKTPPSVCPVCQEEALQDAVFCGQCGTFLMNSEL